MQFGVSQFILTNWSDPMATYYVMVSDTHPMKYMMDLKQFSYQKKVLFASNRKPILQMSVQPLSDHSELVFFLFGDKVAIHKTENMFECAKIREIPNSGVASLLVPQGFESSLVEITENGHLRQACFTRGH